MVIGIQIVNKQRAECRTNVNGNTIKIGLFKTEQNLFYLIQGFRPIKMMMMMLKNLIDRVNSVKTATTSVIAR